MKILIKRKEGAFLPEYQHPGDAGADIYAFLPDGPVEIGTGETEVIMTGIHVSIPEGYEIQIRPRSGLAAKHGITVLNSPGTIDCNFRGEIGVILHNSSNEVFTVDSGDRIAQMVLCPVYNIVWAETDELPDTLRGENGFGSTGV